MFLCSLVLIKKPVLLFFCLFKQQHVLMSSCLSPTTCSHVLLSFQTTTCSHVLMSSKQQHVLMFSCLSKTTCSSVFPQKEPCSPVQLCLYVAKKNGWEQRSQPLSLELCLLFSKADSLLRTYACACTALCAEIRVDRILFAFWDCLYWALANTCTACDAVVTNYVSHN